MGVGSGPTAPKPGPSSERNSRFIGTGLLVSWKKARWLRVYPISFRISRDFTAIVRLAFLSLSEEAQHVASCHSDLVHRTEKVE